MEVYHIETPADIATNYIDYLYLRRKRLLEINQEDDEKYGEGEQDSFALVYSPDRLETEYPLGQYSIKLPRWAEPCTHNAKTEWFAVSDLKELDPLKAQYGSRIYVHRYESFDKVDREHIEDPIGEFLNALKIFIMYREDF